MEGYSNCLVSQCTQTHIYIYIYIYIYLCYLSVYINMCTYIHTVMQMIIITDIHWVYSICWTLCWEIFTLMIFIRAGLVMCGNKHSPDLCGLQRQSFFLFLPLVHWGLVRALFHTSLTLGSQQPSSQDLEQGTCGRGQESSRGSHASNQVTRITLFTSYWPELISWTFPLTKESGSTILLFQKLGRVRRVAIGNI